MRLAIAHIMTRRDAIDWGEIQKVAQELLNEWAGLQKLRCEARLETKWFPYLIILVNDVEAATPGTWWNHPRRTVQRPTRPGEDLRLDHNDWRLQNLYAGLCVLARDTFFYLARDPQATEFSHNFHDVVAEVSRDENFWHGEVAFPRFSDAQAKSLPSGFAQVAAKHEPSVKALTDPNIIHEWTIKPGKKLFDGFVRRFEEKFDWELKAAIKEDYEKRQGGGNGDAIPTEIFSAILTHGLADRTIWYPLSVYLGFLLNRTGYCEIESVQ